MIYAKKNPEKYVLFALVFSWACSEYLFGAIYSDLYDSIVVTCVFLC